MWAYCIEKLRIYTETAYHVGNLDMLEENSFTLSDNHIMLRNKKDTNSLS